MSVKNKEENREEKDGGSRLTQFVRTKKKSAADTFSSKDRICEECDSLYDHELIQTPFWNKDKGEWFFKGCCLKCSNTQLRGKRHHTIYIQERLAYALEMHVEKQREKGLDYTKVQGLADAIIALIGEENLL